jgi:hypothetical protein
LSRLSRPFECGALLGSRRGAIGVRAAPRRRTPKRGVFVVGALFLCVVIATIGSATDVVQLQPASLCERQEKVIFSCPVAGKAPKFVSLCASKELTRDRGYLQYRFGLPGKIELEYPEQREQTQRAFKYSHYFRAQFDTTAISFSRAGYEYTIYDDYNGEQKPARHDQGVRITAPNKEWTLNCRGRAKVQFGDLSGVLEEQPEP